jgi:hypothetical protein
MNMRPDIPIVKTATPVESARALLAALAESHAARGKAGTATVRAAVAAGEALIPVMEAAPERGRQAFIRTSLESSKTVVNECLRLAREVSRVEEYLDGAPSKSHSIAGAIRFLSGKTAKKAKKPDLCAAWKKATAEERTALFATVNFDEVREAFPAEFVRNLEGHFSSSPSRPAASILSGRPQPS